MSAEHQRVLEQKAANWDALVRHMLATYERIEKYIPKSFERGTLYDLLLRDAHPLTPDEYVALVVVDDVDRRHPVVVDAPARAAAIRERQRKDDEAKASDALVRTGEQATLAVPTELMRRSATEAATMHMQPLVVNSIVTPPPAEPEFLFDDEEEC